MTAYSAPLKDINFVLNEQAGLALTGQLPGLEEATPELVEAVLEEAGRLASEVLAPINHRGDQVGAAISDKQVRSAPGFAAAYRAFADGGWPALPFPPERGGQGLPELVSTAVGEIWQSANMAFSLCPMLTEGAAVALEVHGSAALKDAYLPQMIAGTWTGTMNLTESQAGSDLAAVKTKATPEGDHYLLSGQKIYITWGDQDFSENIIHLVLARLPDAPPGIKGLSLFLVPKFLLNADGSIGERNDVYPVSIEHKLGIHASPTCVMSFGDNGGAVGHLVGEKNNGIACMFTMMNHARIAVGVEGMSISERAYQQALDYAKGRIQGRAPGAREKSAIIQHADVRRMLMLMKAGTEAMRAFCYVAASSLDHMHHAPDEQARDFHHARFALLTPVVKAWCTELAQEMTYLGIQIHGGMGFIEETGAAQHYRDARITTIYEGTTGIQAQDLIGRKILKDNAAALTSFIVELKQTAAQLSAADHARLGSLIDNYHAAIKALEDASDYLIENYQQDAMLPGAVAFNFLMLMGTLCGGWQLGKAALVCLSKLNADSEDRGDADFYAAKITAARFYAEHILPRTHSYLHAILAGSESIMALKEEQF